MRSHRPLRTRGEQAASRLRRRGFWTARPLLLSAPWTLLATTQCPPEFGEKPAWVLPVGFVVLALFFGLGLFLPFVAHKHLKPYSASVRAVGLVVALCAMLFVWLVGTWIFFNRFVLTC